MIDQKRSALRQIASGVKPAEKKAAESSQQLFRNSSANELFVAVVGPAGAGAGTAATALKRFLEEIEIDGHTYEVHIVKASNVIANWATKSGKTVPARAGRKSIDDRIAMQNLGDEFREAASDNAAVMRGVIQEIRGLRSKASGLPAGDIDGKPRAFIIDSLRHPAEAHLLRRLYQDAFTLIGVVCEPDQRRKRLLNMLFDLKDRNKHEVRESIEKFMDRDSNAPEKHGQHVTDTFHEADFFVDNTLETENLDETGMNEALLRFVDLATGRTIVRPTASETAMNDAHSAQLRSACLSRQVGAALVDANGNVVSTGTNEVPKFGGGLYGESFDIEGDGQDHRCAFRETKFCSNNKEQNSIIEELFKEFPELIDGKNPEEVLAKVRKTRLGGLVEFSRAVHAEMDAILSAARVGVSPKGCRLFVTTFPCHYCARHIVSAGISEVQYIEPYPKSRALALHNDSITMDSTMALAKNSKGLESDRTTPDKVLFRPFVGVSPRLYRRSFLKDRDYKDKFTGEFAMGEPQWTVRSTLFTKRYTELEAELNVE